jgi:antitoxin VapB
MSLNIKDDDVHRLAREIARATGQSMTQVVREALQERHRQLREARARAGAAELLALARQVSERAEGPAPDHAALLYDERGLPR